MKMKTVAIISVMAAALVSVQAQVHYTTKLVKTKLTNWIGIDGKLNTNGFLELRQFGSRGTNTAMEIRWWLNGVTNIQRTDLITEFANGTNVVANRVYSGAVGAMLENACCGKLGTVTVFFPNPTNGLAPIAVQL